MRWVLRAIAAMVVLAAGMGQAQAPPKRLALVIGNGAYATAGWALANPPRDARLMAERLKGLGFEVDLVVDASRTQLETAMGDFGAKLKAAGPTAVSFFFYAGHGAQKDGANYLVPVDANAATMDRLRFQSPPMQFLLDDMIETGNAVNILVLDACRNLPLPDGARSVGGEGLADLGKPQNFFIAYATSPGRTAADGGGQNSPFTAALAAAMERQAEEPIALLFSDVNNRVFRATEGGQSPEYRDGLVRARRWSFASDRAAPPAPTTPGAEFRDCPECPLMVVVPAGSFVMGSPPNELGRGDDEGPQRRVTISRPFAVGQFEITAVEWDACVAGGGCIEPDVGPYSPRDAEWRLARSNPIVNVGWRDAKRYVEWLNRRVGGRAYRLLTEAEWEYAARAGTATPFSTGTSINPNQADYNWEVSFQGSPTRDREGIDRSSLVGSFPRNPFGIHDMHGNVREWVEDCFSESYLGLPTDGSANLAGGDCAIRMIRGGAWTSEPMSLRSASRDSNTLNHRYFNLGFRVARTLS